jgi:hypothetical protein
MLIKRAAAARPSRSAPFAICAPGVIPCVGAGCASPPFPFEALAPQLDAATSVAFARAMWARAAGGAHASRRAEEARLAARFRAGLDRALPLPERVQLLRSALVEAHLNTRCPRCASVFFDYDACNALKCASPRCGAAFCAVCLEDCGENAHPHVQMRHGGVANLHNTAMFSAARRARFVARLAGGVRSLEGEGEALQRAVVAELAVADLPGVGVSAREVLVRAGLGAADAGADGEEGGGAGAEEGGGEEEEEEAAEEEAAAAEEEEEEEEEELAAALASVNVRAALDTWSAPRLLHLLLVSGAVRGDGALCGSLWSAVVNRAERNWGRAARQRSLEAAVGGACLALVALTLSACFHAAAALGANWAQTTTLAAAALLLFMRVTEAPEDPFWTGSDFLDGVLFPSAGLGVLLGGWGPYATAAVLALHLLGGGARGGDARARDFGAAALLIVGAVAAVRLVPWARAGGAALSLCARWAPAAAALGAAAVALYALSGFHVLRRRVDTSNENVARYLPSSLCDALASSLDHRWLRGALFLVQVIIVAVGLACGPPLPALLALGALVLAHTEESPLRRAPALEPVYALAIRLRCAAAAHGGAPRASPSFARDALTRGARHLLPTWCVGRAAAQTLFALALALMAPPVRAVVAPTALGFAAAALVPAAHADWAYRNRRQNVLRGDARALQFEGGAAAPRFRKALLCALCLGAALVPVLLLPGPATLGVALALGGYALLFWRSTVEGSGEWEVTYKLYKDPLLRAYAAHACVWAAGWAEGKLYSLAVAWAPALLAPAVARAALTVPITLAAALLVSRLLKGARQ